MTTVDRPGAAAPVVVEPIDAGTARRLRQAVLRPHQPPEACVYPGDDRESSGHFGVWVEGELVGVASIYHEARDGVVDRGAWRIRGMATLQAARGRGLGMALLRTCLDHARRRGGTTVWCNARVGVAAFYDKGGFRAEGDDFDLPGIGAHRLMVCRLD